MKKKPGDHDVRSLEAVKVAVESIATSVSLAIQAMKASQIEMVHISGEGNRIRGMKQAQKWAHTLAETVLAAQEKAGSFQGAIPVTESTKPVTDSKKRAPSRKDLRSKSVE